MLSSLGLTSKTLLNKDELRKVRIILNALLEHNQASDFKEPVDWKGMNLTDYPTIIKSPMDLGTIDHNLKNQKYQSVEQVLDHIQLVWDNCKLFNLPVSWFYDTAEKIERSFKKLVKNYFPDIPIVIPLKPATQPKPDQRYSDVLDPDQGITYYDKLNFCKKLEALDESQVATFIKWLQQNFPETIGEDNQDNLQIFVDNFNPGTFTQATQMIRTLSNGSIDFVTKKVKLNSSK